PGARTEVRDGPGLCARPRTRNDGTMSAIPTAPSSSDTGPAQEDPFVALEHEVRLIIRRAQSAGARIARRVHPELDASAYPLLAHIDQHPGVRGSELAQHFGVGRATVSRQLSRLADLGLVRRDVDPEDSRGQCITLTDDGAARFSEARTRRIAM